MARNNDPNQKRPGEKEPGKYHFNPGNMSGKSAERRKGQSEQRANADKTPSRKERIHSRD